MSELFPSRFLFAAIFEDENSLREGTDLAGVGAETVEDVPVLQGSENEGAIG